MLIFSAAFSIGRRCGGGSIRCLSMAARFAPWPRIPNRECPPPPPPPPRISRVPHLMLSSHNNPQIYLFDLDLGDGSQPVIKLDREISNQEIAGRHCVGSSHGFVFSLLVRGLAFHDDVVVAVNPLTGDKLHLPPIARDLTEPISQCLFARLHTKVTLSPSMDFAFLVRRTSFDTGSAYFARLTPRDDEWTLIPSLMTQFEDCIFHKDRFIAVNALGDFTTLNDVGDPSKPPRALVHVGNLDYKEVPEIDRKYLVESPDGEDLFLVYREEDYEDQVLRRTQSFRVWRLDKNNKYMWKPVEGLGGLAFFVGPIRSFSLPAADFPCLKPDSIYFTAHLCIGDSHLSYNNAGLGDTGVFNLQDETIQFFRLPDTMNGVNWLPPTWVAPEMC